MPKIVRSEKKIVRGTIYTAQKLKDTDVKNIENSLKPFFKNKVILLNVQEREGLVGGIRVEAGGYSFDNSVLHHINQFKEQVIHYEN